MERASEAAVGTLQNTKTPANKGRGLGVTFSQRGWTGLTGLEPATSGVTDRHSNQLSYSPQPLTERRNIDLRSGQFNGGLHLNAFWTEGFARSYWATNPSI